MSMSEKLQMLFEAALVDPEPDTPSRLAEMPRNPNGSRGHDHTVEAGTRSELIARLSRFRENLKNGDV